MGYQLISEEEHLCLECGNLLRGRKGKKFCCLVCKNSYNNRKIQNVKRYKAEVIKKLSRNHEILEMLLSEGVKSVGTDTLKRLGFDPYHFTGSQKNAHRHEECYCFDIAYSRTEHKIFNIERLEITKL